MNVQKIICFTVKDAVSTVTSIMRHFLLYFEFNFVACVKKKNEILTILQTIPCIITLSSRRYIYAPRAEFRRGVKRKCGKAKEKNGEEMAIRKSQICNPDKCITSREGQSTFSAPATMKDSNVGIRTLYQKVKTNLVLLKSSNLTVDEVGALKKPIRST